MCRRMFWAARASLLFCDLRDAGQRLAGLVTEIRQVARDENLGMPGHRQIGVHDARVPHGRAAHRGSVPGAMPRPRRPTGWCARAAPRSAPPRSVSVSAAMLVTATCSHTSTPRRCSARRAELRSDSGNEARIVAPPLEQDDARRLGIDRVELAPKTVMRDLGKRACHFDAGRTAADDGECQQVALACRSGSRSASSKARSIRRRIASASSSVLRPGATPAHSA